MQQVGSAMQVDWVDVKGRYGLPLENEGMLGRENITPSLRVPTGILAIRFWCSLTYTECDIQPLRDMMELCACPGVPSRTKSVALKIYETRWNFTNKEQLCLMLHINSHFKFSSSFRVLIYLVSICVSILHVLCPLILYSQFVFWKKLRSILWPISRNWSK